LLKISKFTKALADADKCIELRPNWEKGYFRKGGALEGMSNFQAALDVYREGAKQFPNHKEMALKSAQLETKIKQLKAKQKAEERTAGS
jgi:tetratricopeptide (TPR) repeat protein